MKKCPFVVGDIVRFTPSKKTLMEYGNTDEWGTKIGDELEIQWIHYDKLYFDRGPEWPWYDCTFVRKGKKKNIKPSIIKLEMKKVGLFYSTMDEASFFKWLKKLGCIKKYKFEGSTITIEIFNTKVNEWELNELIALFYRYKFDLKPLSVFDRAEFSNWFKEKEAYWYKSIFGK